MSTVSRSLRQRLAPRSVAVLAVVSLLAAGCSGGSGGSTAKQPAKAKPISTSAPIKGQHIVVLMPSYAQIPKALLADFTAKTGVTVTLNSAEFDGIHQRLVTAAVGNTNIADVAEIDWSWVGQFGQAGWYTPLETSLDPSLQSDLQNLSTFKAKGHILGVPYSNDFRIAAYNKDMFAKAGVDPPKTFDDLHTAMLALKQKAGVKYPLSLSLSATEGTATVWYLITLAMGGKLFDNNLNPQFDKPNSVAAKALQFEVDAVKEGLVSPGSVSNTDQQSDDRFFNGSAGYVFGGPDEVVSANDPTSSKIVHKAALALVPGANGPGPTFGLPEGVGIPASSTHKSAALAFLKWMSSPEVVVKLRASIGVLPCRTSVLKQLNDSGNLVGGDVIEQQAKHITPLFPQGTPTWYPKFSSEAGALVNSAAKGDITVAEALKRLAALARKLAGK